MSDALPIVREQKSAFDRLKRRQKRFVEQYVIGNTGSEAMRSIGYKGKYAHIRASRWLSRPEIQAAVEERTEAHLRDVTARKHKTLEQVVAIAYADPRKVVDQNGMAVPLERMDADIAAAISSVEVENISINGETGTRYKYRFWDKNKALDRLGQWQQLWDGPGTKVNVDARTAVVNVGGAEAVRAVADLGSRIAGLVAGEGAPAPDPNGLVLPAPVRDGQAGHRAPVDAGEDSRGSE
jgi:phage terminase small subunit